MNVLSYLVKDGFRSFFKNFAMTISCIIIVSACLIFLGVYLAFTTNISHIADEAQNNYWRLALIQPGTSDAKLEQIKTKILSTENVARVEFKSKEVGLQEMIEQGKISPDAVELVKKDNPLPDGYVIYFKSLETADNTIVQIKSANPEIYQVEGLGYSAKQIDNQTKLIRYIALALMVFMLVISIFIISNTIRLSVFARRHDINIMKFLGATDWFVRWPFIIEGMLIGIVGASVAFLCVYFIYAWFTTSTMLPKNILNMLVPSNTIANLFAISFYVFGTLIGAFGSIMSVRKHLKV